MFACVYMPICENEFTIEVFIETKENCKSFKEPHLLLQTTITMKVARLSLFSQHMVVQKRNVSLLVLKSIP